MSKTHKINHNEDDLEKALGLDRIKLGIKLKEILKNTKPKNEEKNWSESLFIEAISKEFSSLELAFLFGKSLEQIQQLSYQLQMLTVTMRGGICEK